MIKLDEGNIVVRLEFNENNSATIIVQGDIVSENVNDLKVVLDDAVEKGYFNLDVDMDEVQYINSSGVGILMMFYSKIKENDGVLKIKNVSTELAALFESMNMDRIFNMETK